MSRNVVANATSTITVKCAMAHKNTTRCVRPPDGGWLARGGQTVDTRWIPFFLTPPRFSVLDSRTPQDIVRRKFSLTEAGDGRRSGMLSETRPAKVGKWTEPA